MDLPNLEYDDSYDYNKLLSIFSRHYEIFYHEMIRMSNVALSDYIGKYIDLILDLTKNPIPENVFRAGVGIVALHVFGFRDFNILSKLMDRIIPQQKESLVYFTSWAVGKLIHHPDVEKTRYVNHLFTRIDGWLHANGRRSRPLAAAAMIYTLSANAGSTAVVFLTRIQQAVTVLLSKNDPVVNTETVLALTKFTKAVIRYRRAALTSYLEYYIHLCLTLISFCNQETINASMNIFEKLIKFNPELFVQYFGDIYDTIEPIYNKATSQKLRNSVVSLETALSSVDPVQFMDLYSPIYFNQIIENLKNGAPNISFCIGKLITHIPDYVIEESDKIQEIITMLVEKRDFAQCFDIFVDLLNFDPNFFQPFDEELLRRLVNEPVIDIHYHNFFVTFVKQYQNIPEFLSSLLCQRITSELSQNHNQQQCLELIGNLPTFVFPHDNELLPLVMKSTKSDDPKVRISVPKALFNLVSSQQVISMQEVVLQELQTALSETTIDVRVAILKSIGETCPNELASPDCLALLRIFANDDAATVKIVLLDILAELNKISPMGVAAISRSSIINNFYILKNVNSIRRRSRIARILPHMISAAARTVKIYTPTFLEIFFAELSQNQLQKYNNFMEQNSSIIIKVGLIDSLRLLAPLDPAKIRENSDKIIEILCDYLIPTEERGLIISVLKCLTELLSPRVSSVEIRSKCPDIYTACSLILAETSSRKVRIAALEVIGSMGVIDVHQKGPEKVYQNSEFLNQRLTRQFFLPSKDIDTDLSEASFINRSMTDIYYATKVAKILLNILSDPSKTDLYVSVCKALVQVIDANRHQNLQSLDLFVHHLLLLMESSESEDFYEYNQVMIDLIQAVQNNILPYIPMILESINKKFTFNNAKPFVKLIYTLCKATKDAIIPYFHPTLCLLIDTLDNSKTSKTNTSITVLQILTQICRFSCDQLYLIISQISDVIMSEHSIPCVRIEAIKSLENIAMTNCDLLDYTGIIIRAIKSILFSQLPETDETYVATMSLLSTLIKYYGAPFLFESAPILDRLKEEGKETQELIDIVTSIEIGKVFEKPVPAIVTVPRRVNDTKRLMLNEEIIIAKAGTPNFGECIHLEQWLISLVRLIIQASPMKAVTACTPIANVDEDTALQLFKLAFASTYPRFSDAGKKVINDSFVAVLTTKENYEKVCREIISVLVFMHKVGQPLNVSKQTIVGSCVRYGCLAYALKLQEELYVSEPNNLSVITDLINVYVGAGQRQNAIAVYKKCKNILKNPTDILAKLQFYDHCIDPYSERYKKNKHDTNAFVGLIKSLSALSQWKELMDYLPDFENHNRKTQNQTATFFADAALHLGKWDILADILEYTPDDSARCNIITALKGLHDRDFEKVDECLEHGFSLIASQPITFWTEHQKLHIETILASQRLVEIREMKDWLTSDNKQMYVDLWAQRLRTTPPNFDIWFELISNRTCITKIHDEDLIHFFQLRSPTLGTSIHINTFEILFPNHKYSTAPELDKLCYVIAKRNAGFKEESLTLLRDIIPLTQGKLRCQCDYLYASWIIEDDDSCKSNKIAYQSLLEASSLAGINTTRRRSSTELFERAVQQSQISQSQTMTSILLSPRRFSRYSTIIGEYQFSKPAMNELTSNVMKIDISRKLASVCAELINSDYVNVSEYVTIAIECLTECLQHSASFTDVVQLLNIFFEHADSKDIFQKTSQSIRDLPTKFLIQTAAQLLVQLSHPTKPVADFVHDLLLDLLKEHYHAFIFSVIVMQESLNENRRLAAMSLFEEFVSLMPDEAEEIIMIRDALLRLSVTWYDKVYQLLGDARNSFVCEDYEDCIEIIREIRDTIQRPGCELERNFLREYQTNISQMDHFLDNFNPTSHFQLTNLDQWIANFDKAIYNVSNSIKYIQLQTISTDLCEKEHFKFAVPGTYKPDKELIRIKYFIQQISIFNSKQQPKSIVIMGEDGNFYQYLLKGHEDLRLDERIMQFFHLVNSILKKESIDKSFLIRTMVVVPISVSNGLVQWVPGTDTLSGIVETYRTLYKRPVREELDLFVNTTNSLIDSMMPIQRLWLIKKVFAKVPDTDIANFFWLSAKDAENWLKITNTFTISTATNSVIGYIIGLGDRHPGNLLIDKLTGKVVHIDFGDCFEQAMNRKMLPEVVPFRLTRMIVKAMGVTGVDGLFRSSFSEMLSLMRDNWRNLILVLAIFVHEPLLEEPDRPKSWKEKKIHRLSPEGVSNVGIPRSESQTDEIRLKVKHKLTGHDFGYRNGPMTVAEQTDALIEAATNEYNLAKMYHGWSVYW